MDKLKSTTLVERIPEKLFQALEKIDRPGTFCAQGSLPVVLPGLEIAGVGPIALPLTTQQAEQIKQQCTQAPYGKGEQTITDTSVRRVWQMMPDQFLLKNPQWQEFLTQTVRTVEIELGLEGQKLESHLYNLLLYEKGSFFLPHQDGEKLDRMVATLVVVLPSTFEGGELLIRHEGQEQTIDFASLQNSSYNTHFVAFYADCEHEVRPLLKGYRLCLVYNLALQKQKGQSAISAPRSLEHIETVAAVLRDWCATKDENSPEKLAITLDHQYSQDGLAWDALKGVDRAKAQVIRYAARQAGCKAYLALLTFWQTGSAEYSGSGVYSSRGSRWHDDGGEEPSNYVMEDLIDSSLTAEHWLDDEDQRLEIGSMSVAEDEVVPEESLMEVEPEEEFEGYTGNAGMTLERWYRHAAIFIWPEKRHFQILCNCGSQSASSALNLLVRQWTKARSPEKAALKAQCIEFAEQIIAHWNEVRYGREFEEDKPGTCELVLALELLDDSKLIRAFLAHVMLRDVSMELSTQLLRHCEKYGWSAFQKEFIGIFQSTTLESLHRNVRLLEQLCSKELLQNQERLALCELLSQKVLSGLKIVDKHKNDWRTMELDRSRLLGGLIRSFVVSEQPEALSQLVAHTLNYPEQYPLKPVLVQAMLNLRDWVPKHVKQSCVAPLSQWLKACHNHLECLTAEIPQEPSDYCREAAFPGHCADCRELISFLKDPGEKVYRFRVRQDRRGHLHQIIEKYNCDVEHVTERKGSPQTLVCTKNIASFHRKMKQYQEDKTHLAALRSIEVAIL